MAFYQEPPALTDTYAGDVVLREHLERLLPAEVRAAVEPALAEMGVAAAGELRVLAAEAEATPPRHVPYDPWGRRIDRIVTSRAWDELQARAAEAGLVAIPHEDEHGPAGRIVQHALLHLYGPSSAIATCPVAMTDGAARVLRDHADTALRDRVVPRLLSRDRTTAWTAGQWMTEREGGSDVSRTATVARCVDGRWQLHGTKWFTSATTADVALTLARPEGAGPGSAALGLFCVELADPDTGRPRFGDTVRVNRLKDKLGTRALPTAELTLDGVPATPVGPPERGLARIAGMLTVTRLHNAVAAAAGMRRAVDLAVAYARVRGAFGRPLLALPLHRATLADLAVLAEAAFALVIRAAELVGRVERGVADDHERRVARGLVPLAKLATGKDAVAVASEAIEAFGGAGYVEDTGLPTLLRDAQVLPIWEGTTNVLSLDLLRAEQRDGAVSALLDDVERLLGAVPAEGALTPVAATVRTRAQTLRRAVDELATAADEVVQAGMRALALRLGAVTSAALLCAHAAARQAAGRDASRAGTAASRFTALRLADAWRLPTAAELAQTGALLDPGA
ncbi:MAG TPA: acyl-CoA dehydrogenase family protein [Egibacteraceae bacterium]